MTVPLRVVFSLVAVAGALAAQQSLDAQPAGGDPRVAVHGNSHQPGEAPYGLWAAGGAYKASFHGGMTFYPQLGRDYPRNQPLAWRTTSIRVGGAELLAAGVEPVPSHSDFRVEYPLGPVVEAYDVRVDGLEQTFVFGERPAAAGDLCITGRVTTDLVAAPMEELAADLEFRDARGTALVRYGRAVAIDADGDTFAMTTTCRGNTITLRLPAASLAQADFPLVVDPLMTAVLSSSIGTAVAPGDMDSATESQNPSNNAAHCYTRHFSATDADVIARIGSSDFASATTRFSDLAASTSADHGRLAFLPSTNKWVLCYQSLTTSTQIMELRVAMFSGGAVSPPTTTSLPMTQPAGEHRWRPCVGGIAAGGSGTQALIAYQREVGSTTFADLSDSKVFGALFDTSSALGSFGTPFALLATGVHDYARPSVNRAAEGGSAFSWLVTGQVQFASTQVWQLRGALVTNTGSVSSNWWTGAGVPLATSEFGPLVDGRAGRYLVTFASTDATIPAQPDVRGTAIQCARFDWPHGASFPGNATVTTLATNAFRILETSGIAFHGATQSHWTLAWRSSSTAPAIYAARVGYRAELLQPVETVALTASSTPGWPAVCNDERDETTVIAYQRHQGTLGEVWRRTWINPAVSVPTLSSANCSSAVLAWQGPTAASMTSGSAQWIGSGLSRLTVSGAPANSLHLVLVGTATANSPIVDPILGANCSLLVPLAGPDHLGFLTVAVGASAAWTLPLPESLPAMTLSFQDWVLEPANSLLWGTRRLSVPLVK